MQDYRAEGMEENMLQQAYAPIGIQIKRNTGEIAVSIAAQIITVKKQVLSDLIHFILPFHKYPEGVITAEAQNRIFPVFVFFFISSYRSWSHRSLSWRHLPYYWHNRSLWVVAQ